MSSLIRCFMIGSLVVVSASIGLCKGHSDLILIKRGSDPPVEIKQPEVLNQFDPWGGQFADWKLGTTPPPVDQSDACRVFFFMKWPHRHSSYDRGDLKMIYEFSYVPAANEEPGYVYLPAKGDELYRVNISTIIRDGQDGHWFRASHSWAEAFSKMKKTVIH
jgi:hypothetical protein